MPFTAWYPIHHQKKRFLLAFSQRMPRRSRAKGPDGTSGLVSGSVDIWGARPGLTKAFL